MPEKDESKTLESLQSPTFPETKKKLQAYQTENDKLSVNKSSKAK